MNSQKNKFDSLVNKVVALMSDYLALNEDKDIHVLNYISGDDLLAQENFDLPEKGSSDEDLLLEEIKKYLKYSVRTSHPQFNNQLNGGFHLASFVGEMISFLANTSMATYEIAPYATILERKLIEKLASLIGYKTFDGIMVTGGSNANLLAIHCARFKKNPEIKRKGMGSKKDFVVYVSENSHYSFKKGMNLLGLGIDNIYPIKNDEHFRMSPEALEKAIEHTFELGKIPLMVASTAGTTVFGSFDPVIEIAKIAKKYDIWHHIDGAWGAPVLFSSKLKHLLAGSELSDSFTWDSHKLMGTGLITSFFLSRHENILREVNGGGGGSYIFHEYENAKFDFGPASLQCGRKPDAFKLWLEWKDKGDQGFADLVEGQFAKMQFALNFIKSHPRFELVHEPTYLNLCFKVLPLDKEKYPDINQYNYDLRFKLMRSGRAMVNLSELRTGDIFFRLVFANPATTEEDLSSLFDILLELAD